MSRVNHRCDNNADHYFIRHTGRTNGVCSLFATQAIRVNEQIFISYVNRVEGGGPVGPSPSKKPPRGFSCSTGSYEVRRVQEEHPPSK